MAYKKRQNEEPERAPINGLFTNPLAEHAVIEAILHNPARAWDHIINLNCNEEWFTDRLCFAAFKALSVMMKEGRSIDSILVADEIGKQYPGGLAQEFLQRFSQASGNSSTNLSEHLLLLQDKLHRRDVCFYLDDAKERLLTEPNVDVVVSTMQRCIHNTLKATAHKVESADELHARIIDNFEFAKTTGGAGIDFPWPSLRALSRSVTRGKMTLVVARPGEGKSTFANQMAAYCAIDLGEPAGVWSLEMTRKEWVENMVGARLGIEARKMRQGRYNPDELERFKEGLLTYKDIPLFIDDETYTIDQLCSSIRTAVIEKRLSLVVIDYLGIIKKDAKMTHKSDQEILAAWSNEINNLAKECENTAFVVIHQLNRGAVQDGNKRPELHNIRGSGALEQDAYMVIFVYQDPNIEGSMPDNARTLLEVAKDRGGPKGSASVVFEKSKQRFV